ncbi:MAG: hypothetical protein GF308_00650 [Candidatus Heimdallarchaeota archaeon]|nr:hypothetical protein [Candidatus Heimdallarchaeota archaeon]
MTTVIIEGTKKNGETFRKEVKKEIEMLSLSYNQLSSVDLAPLAKCPELQRLSLSSNQLLSVNLSPLVQCQELRRIWLDSPTTILWGSANLASDSLPEGLREYQDKIQEAHQRHLAKEACNE